MKILIILVFICLTGCLVPPSPHHHKYISKDLPKEFIEVFCTPKSKLFVYHKSIGLGVEMCSKIFDDNCESMEYGTYFETKAYLNDVQLQDGRFHKIFKMDTILLKIDSSNKVKLFIPVL